MLKPVKIFKTTINYLVVSLTKTKLRKTLIKQPIQHTSRKIYFEI